MVNQVRLSQSPWWNQCHIVIVGEQFHQVLCLLHTVTEILRSGIAFCYKRICHIQFIIIVRCKVKHFFSYSQLFYRKYDNHKHDNHKSDNRNIVRLSKQLSKKDYPIWIKAKAGVYKSKSLLPLRRMSSVQGVETWVIWLSVYFGLYNNDLPRSHLPFHPSRRYRPWCIYSGTRTPKCASKFFREKFVIFASKCHNFSLLADYQLFNLWHLLIWNFIQMP